MLPQFFIVRLILKYPKIPSIILFRSRLKYCSRKKTKKVISAMWFDY